MIKSFGVVGTELTMTAFNRMSKLPALKDQEKEGKKEKEADESRS